MCVLGGRGGRSVEVGYGSVPASGPCRPLPAQPTLGAPGTRLTEAFREQSGEPDPGACWGRAEGTWLGWAVLPTLRGCHRRLTLSVQEEGPLGMVKTVPGKIDLEPGAAALPGLHTGQASGAVSRPPVLPAVWGTVLPGESAISTGQPQALGRSGRLEARSCLASVSLLVRAGPGEPCGGSGGS